jgi:hypothetical protein
MHSTEEKLIQSKCAKSEKPFWPDAFDLSVLKALCRQSKENINPSSFTSFTYPSACIHGNKVNLSNELCALYYSMKYELHA